MDYATDVIGYQIGAYRNKALGALRPCGYRVMAIRSINTGRPPYKSVKRAATIKVFPIINDDLDRANKQAGLYTSLMNRRNRRRLGSANPKWGAEYKGKRWCEDYERSGLRVVGFANEIASLHHTGWYIDDFQGETYRGIVFQLPARDGQERYLAGYIASHNSDAALIDMDIFDDKIGAAHAADSMAERDAEQEREYQEAWQRGQRADEHDAMARQYRANILDLLNRVRLEGKPAEGTTAYVLLADKVGDLLGDMRRERKDRDELIHDAPTYDKRLRDAFNEGYGKEVL